MVVGAVVGSYSLMQFFFSPVWGRLSDRIGRRPVLLISLTGSAIGYLIFAFAHSLAILFVARIVAGIAAANIGTAQAYIADITPPQDRAKGMGMIGAAFGLGFIFGPPMGGLLSDAGVSRGLHGNFLPGIAACALSLTALIIGFIALRESKSADLVPRTGVPPQFDRTIWSMVFGRRVLGTVLGTLFLIILAFAGLETTVTLHGRARFDFDAKDLGYFFGLMGVIVALVQGVLIGTLTRRFGERATAASGALSLAIGLAAIPLIYDSRFLYGVAVFVALGQGLSFPSLNSLISKLAPLQDRGSILGISAALGSLSRIIGPILGGILYDAGAPQRFGGARRQQPEVASVLGDFLMRTPVDQVVERADAPAPQQRLAAAASLGGVDHVVAVIEPVTDQLVDQVGRVLAVAVDEQRGAEPGVIEAGHQRRLLAEVARQRKHLHVECFRRQRAGDREAVVAAAVVDVDHLAGEAALLAQPPRHRGEPLVETREAGGLVVDRHHDRQPGR